MYQRIFNKNISNLICPLCEGTKYIKDKDGNVIKCNVCYLPNKFLDANIGLDYWGLNPKNWKGEKEDLKKILPYITKEGLQELINSGNGFYIFGDYGVGKTSLANMILMAAVAAGYTGLFVPFSELVMLTSKIMNGWHDQEIEDSLNQIKNVDFLVLDDLAKEYDNERDNGRATLNSILRYRDMWRKPTIYTSNIKIEETKTKYGGSNYSVIYGRSHIINMVNENDFRRERKLKADVMKEVK
jgi:DNA replication protein DnaC